jgi:hypothetical protein
MEYEFGRGDRCLSYDGCLNDLKIISKISDYVFLNTYKSTRHTFLRWKSSSKSYLQAN